MTDLTTITTPFGLLDEATQKALREHDGHCEIWAGNRWSPHRTRIFSTDKTYRVRPEPTRPLVVRDWSVFADWVRFVVRDADGQIWGYECRPKSGAEFWSHSGDCCANILTALSPTIIDPGTCDWREAIAERPEFEPTFKTGGGVDHEPPRLSKEFFGISADKFSDDELVAIAETVALELAERKQFGRLTNE